MSRAFPQLFLFSKETISGAALETAQTSQTLGYNELTLHWAPRHPYPPGKASREKGYITAADMAPGEREVGRAGSPGATRQEGPLSKAQPPRLEEALGPPAIAACPFPHTEPLLVLILQAAELQAGMKAQCDLSEHVRHLFLNQLVLGQWDTKLDPMQARSRQILQRKAPPRPILGPFQAAPE